MRGHATIRRVVFATFILCSIVAISLYSEHWISTLTSDYIVRLESAQELVANEQWAEAFDVTNAIKDDWDSHSFAIHATTRHTEADHILINFLSVLQYLQMEEAEQYLAANTQLMARLQLLAEMEAPTWENIL